MAIIVQEEKKPVNWFNIIIIAVFVVVLFFGMYFIFFKKPELVEVVVPTKLQSLGQISQAQLDPGPTIDTLNKYFSKNFSQSVTIPTPGRTNPFMPL